MKLHINPERLAAAAFGILLLAMTVYRIVTLTAL